MTLRELAKAASDKQKCDWDHTADTLAMLATLHSNGRYIREDFHPLRNKVAPPINLDDPGLAYEQLRKNGK